MKKLLVISDFIENQPVVASVRYSQIMKYLSEKYNLLVINAKCYGADKSQFSTINLKYNIMKSKFSQNLSNDRKSSFVEKLLRNEVILSLWRNYSFSKFNFERRNTELYHELKNILSKNTVDAIFVTVPDIYGLYITEYIKNIFPSIPAVVEIRDIINNNIGKGNPKIAFKAAEKIIYRKTDGMIALSKGIYDYYKRHYDENKIRVIKNGFDETAFSDCKYVKINMEKDFLRFSHIGSIYKGRSIGEFIHALEFISETYNKRIVFDIVGVLDRQAYEEIVCLMQNVDKNKIDINITGAMEHEKAIEILKQTDIAVILTHKKGSDYAIPGKTFEYIGACKPMIAVTEDPPLVELIDGQYGECAKHDSANISEKIKKILNSTYDFTDRLKYSRKNQATQISNFIEQLIVGKVEDN